MKQSHHDRVDAQNDGGQSHCAIRRKRREKMLDAADIRLLMLHFISQGAAHGYELIKSIEELSKGEYTPSPGLIYPNLTLLEEMECISVAEPQAARKACRLEEKGRQLLEQNSALLAATLERLSSLAVLVTNRRRPEVERAIANMKTALNSRLSSATLSTQTLHAIIDALDEATRKIERS